MSTAKYVVITPVRDEADHVGRTIDSVVSQTLRPARWIVVNDGSVDATPQILEKAASQHSWITVVHRPNRGARASGGGVVEAINDGLRHLSVSWDFLVKLDGDLSFDKEYFECALDQFAVDPTLGIGGGTVCVVQEGRVQIDSLGDPPFHVRGATKIYRRQCWEDVSPLVQAPGWDTVDEVKANMHGWTTRTFPELRVIQHKPTGAADGMWRNAFKNGQANYVTGYDPLFMTAKCLKRALGRPPLIYALGLASGFCSGYLRRLPQVSDRHAIRYLRIQQRRRLLLRSSIYG